MKNLKPINERYPELYKYISDMYDETGYFPTYSYASKTFKVSKRTVREIINKIKPPRKINYSRVAISFSAYEV